MKVIYRHNTYTAVCKKVELGGGRCCIKVGQMEEYTILMSDIAELSEIGGQTQMMKRMIDVYSNFEYNIEKARCLLDLVILKKFRDEVFDGVIENFVDDFRGRLKDSLPILRQKEVTVKDPLEIFPDINLLSPPAFGDLLIDVFRKTIKPQIDRHLDINTQTFQQQTVVIAVTALESYLRDRYIIEMYKNESPEYIEKRILEWKKPFQNPALITEKYKEEFGLENVLNLTGHKEEIIKIILIRHIIVHRGGEINVQLCDKFGISKKDWLGKNIQFYLEQNPNFLSESIMRIENFVKQLDKTKLDRDVI